MSECLDENSALELLDGRLPAGHRGRLERHIESCDGCRELVAELAKVEGQHRDGVADTERTPIADRGLTRVGPYRIESEIGTGAAGTVYRAIDDRTKQVVALKLVTDASWRSRFGREAETLSRLAHPGIVRYIGHGETPHGLYLAMEWLDGEDLGRCLRRGPLPWQSARALGLRVTAALAHAHGIGAVHRDLGPRNIFLPGGRVEDAKLLDFGLVRVRDGLERTTSQALLGTPYYMAPEQVKDPTSVDARADLFALGVVLYEVISGKRPFFAEDLFTVWVQIVDRPPPDLRTLTRGVPEAFIVIIEALLRKNPMDRPRSAAEVHQTLLRLEGLATSAAPWGYPPVGSAPARPSGPAGIHSRSIGPPNFVNPGQPPLPPAGAISNLPPARLSPVLAAAGVGVTAIVAASAIVVVGPKLMRRAMPEESNGASGVDASPAVTTSPARAAGVGPPNHPVADPTEPSATTRGTKDADALSKNPDSPPRQASRAPQETLFCGAENVEFQRGGNYRPDPNTPHAPPVTISGRCKATLEDCAVGGPRSILVLGEGDLTLRRCRVLGEVKLVGTVTLTLEGTTLPQAPIILGKARVIRR